MISEAENIFFDTNQALWNAKVPHHVASDFYDLAGFRAGKSSLNRIELEGLGDDVAGKKMLHLQCHFGQDTLSWARMGAEVVGVDFSSVAIQTARDLSAELQIPATFISCNIYDLPAHLEGEFDIVFTSYGTISWLPDLDKWAKIVSQYLKKDGIFYIADFHPTLYLFDFEQQKIAYNYFNEGVVEEMTEGTYALREAPIWQKEYFWQHSLSETLGALLQNNLQLLDFKEFPTSPYNCFSNMHLQEDGYYSFGDFGVSLPHVFSLKMKKI